jgi:prepilin peptidase CpaA
MRDLPPAIVYTLAGLVVLAAACDLKWRRIPNWLTVMGLGLGLTLNIWNGRTASALAGLALGFAAYLPLYLLRAVGGGDLKLMAAAGTIAGPGNWVALFVFSAFIGGAIALAMVVWKGRIGVTMANLGHALSEMSHLRPPHLGRPELDVRTEKGMSLPHAVPIALAALLLLWGGQG